MFATRRLSLPMLSGKRSDGLHEALECASEGVAAEKIRPFMCLNNWYRPQNDKLSLNDIKTHLMLGRLSFCILRATGHWPAHYIKPIWVHIDISIQ